MYVQLPQNMKFFDISKKRVIFFVKLLKIDKMELLTFDTQIVSEQF